MTRTISLICNTEVIFKELKGTHGSGGHFRPQTCPGIVTGRKFPKGHDCTCSLVGSRPLDLIEQGKE